MARRYGGSRRRACGSWTTGRPSAVERIHLRGALLGDRLTLELLVGVSASSPGGHSSGTIAKRLNWQDDTRASLPRSAPGSKPTTGALQRLAYRPPAAASG